MTDGSIHPPKGVYGRERLDFLASHNLYFVLSRLVLLIIECDDNGVVETIVAAAGGAKLSREWRSVPAWSGRRWPGGGALAADDGSYRGRHGSGWARVDRNLQPNEVENAIGSRLKCLKETLKYSAIPSAPSLLMEKVKTQIN